MKGILHMGTLAIIGFLTAVAALVVSVSTAMKVNGPQQVIVKEVPVVSVVTVTPKETPAVSSVSATKKVVTPKPTPLFTPTEVPTGE